MLCHQHLSCLLSWHSSIYIVDSKSLSFSTKKVIFIKEHSLFLVIPWSCMFAPVNLSPDIVETNWQIFIKFVDHWRPSYLGTCNSLLLTLTLIIQYRVWKFSVVVDLWVWNFITLWKEHIDWGNLRTKY